MAKPPKLSLTSADREALVEMLLDGCDEVSVAAAVTSSKRALGASHSWTASADAAVRAIPSLRIELETPMRRSRGFRIRQYERVHAVAMSAGEPDVATAQRCLDKICALEEHGK